MKIEIYFIAIVEMITYVAKYLDCMYVAFFDCLLIIVFWQALSKGIELPGGARFDSNCITPGTEFMARLNEHLKYFINQKLSTDQSWQNVEVIFSGHEVPGEGEHKIMDYIRYQRSQPQYDHNTRHCLYGLDADLVCEMILTHAFVLCIFFNVSNFP